MLTRILLVLLTVLVFGAALTGNTFGAFYPIVFFDYLHLVLWLVGFGGGALVGLLLAWPFIVAEVWWYKIVAEFVPDQLSSQRFITSLRSAPAQFQLTLHSVMRKQCASFG
ncbi:MAG: hypothetical protein L3J36_02540 [Rhodobacteraceae bacterium]|nr:hypothetical protein [Paracoccaceae bacterium]